MKEWIHCKTAVIFWTTLAIYVLICFTVSYVGVYVTYIAGPILLVTGILAWLTKPREGANKRGNSSRLTQSFHFFMFEPIFSPVNALNQPI